ncbi:MAG: response regulator [Opitutae bacterium]|nr:response regulator [Opitutae bacterium]
MHRGDLKLAPGKEEIKTVDMARPTTALIVDDEPHVRVYLRMLLRSLGVTQVWEASDGKQAVELYTEHRPAVVLLDMVMPHVGGTQTLRDLQAIEPDVPVVVVTSQSSLKIVEEMHQLGAIAYLLKHTPREQMMKTLTEALDSLDPDLAGE